MKKLATSTFMECPWFALIHQISSMDVVEGSAWEIKLYRCLASASTIFLILSKSTPLNFGTFNYSIGEVSATWLIVSLK